LVIDSYFKPNARYNHPLGGGLFVCSSHNGALDKKMLCLLGVSTRSVGRQTPVGLALYRLQYPGSSKFQWNIWFWQIITSLFWESSV